MKYRTLTQQQYDERLRLVIAGVEGLHARSQNVGDDRATIGWGYTFNRNDNVAIWKASGIELNGRQWAALKVIDLARDDEKTRLGLAFDRQLNAAESDSLLRASLSDYERPANRLNMPLSDERIALTSVAYNRGPHALTGKRGGNEHPVMAAIRDGDRAEAWYQLRYNCWGTKKSDEGGLRKRRFADAEIDRVEDRFGDSLDAPPARPNRIAQANRDYPELTALYGRVPTLEAALAPARRALGQSASSTPAANCHTSAPMPTPADPPPTPAQR